MVRSEQDTAPSSPQGAWATSGEPMRGHRDAGDNGESGGGPCSSRAHARWRAKAPLAAGAQP